VIQSKFLSEKTQSLVAIVQNLVDRATEISSTLVETIIGPEEAMVLF
jgi:hypothetical protein